MMLCRRDFVTLEIVHFRFLCVRIDTCVHTTTKQFTHVVDICEKNVVCSLSITVTELVYVVE